MTSAVKTSSPLATLTEFPAAFQCAASSVLPPKSSQNSSAPTVTAAVEQLGVVDIAAKLGVRLTAVAGMLKLQVALLPQAALPVHPLNVYPLLGVAVNVTGVAAGNETVQLTPQLMPTAPATGAPLAVTVPLIDEVVSCATTGAARPQARDRLAALAARKYLSCMAKMTPI